MEPVEGRSPGLPEWKGGTGQCAMQAIPKGLTHAPLSRDPLLTGCSLPLHYAGSPGWHASVAVMGATSQAPGLREVPGGGGGGAHASALHTASRTASSSVKCGW